jgi:hypothetical protein
MRTPVSHRIRLVLLVSLVVLAVAACTRNVPLRHEFAFQNTPDPKVAKRLLVVMDKAQADKVIIHKPGALSDTFRYEAGPALRDSLMHLMQATFEQADFGYALPDQEATYDYYLLADFKDYKIDLGRTLVSNKRFNVYIDYDFMDGSRHTIFTTETDGDNINRYSGGDIATAVNPFVFIGTGKAENMLGDGWDGAVANSLNEFYFDLEAYLDENGLK